MTLAIVPALSGDYNGNGVVDAADYVVWRNRLGSNDPVADGDASGVVDAADFDVWKIEFRSGRNWFGSNCRLRREGPRSFISVAAGDGRIDIVLAHCEQTAPTRIDT